MHSNLKNGRGQSARSIAITYAAVEILEEIQPCTVRAICYQLFGRRLIPDMSKASTDKVSRLLVRARETGLIDWKFIVDETRQAEVIASWENPLDIIRAAMRQYRKDYWQDQPRRVEVWSEKGTVRGTLAPVLREFGITFRVLHGFGSATALHEAAEFSQGSNKPLTVLYVGDWDPSGLWMSARDLPERLARYGGVVRLQRIALSEGDVDERQGLPGFHATEKAKDGRFRWFVANYGMRCVELDALSPAILRVRVAGAIEELLDLEAWTHALKIETAERECMEKFEATLEHSILRQADKYSGDVQ